MPPDRLLIENKVTFFATPDLASAELFFDGVTKVQYLRNFGDGDRSDLAAGYWFASPEDVPGVVSIGEMTLDNTLTVLEGHLVYTEVGGDSYDVTAGTSISLRTGFSYTVEVKAPTVEFFVYSTPSATA